MSRPEQSPPTDQHADARYLRALREHDSRVLNELYAECAPKITAWVIANNGNASDAGDLFQDALVSLYHSAHKPDFRLTCPIGALLFTICRNRWINQLRRKKKEVAVRKFEAIRYEVESDSEPLLERLEEEELERSRLRTTFSQLSETCQKALRLLARGLTPAEAAEKLGMKNANTLYRRKHACVNRWRELLDPDDK